MVLRIQRVPIVSIPSPQVHEFEKGIEELFSDLFERDAIFHRGDFPPVNMMEDDNVLEVVAELPGVRKEDLSVTLRDGGILITGERKSPALPEKAAWLRNETSHGTFSRTIRLPCEVKPAEITAALKNGVLRIVLPKAEAARRREIHIK